MGKELKEEKILVLKRVPPGDKWVFSTTPNGTIYPSLTDALEAWYQNTGDTNFYIEARKGTVEIVKQSEIETEVKRFSLYGED
jgi:hypothetical protein